MGGRPLIDLVAEVAGPIEVVGAMEAIVGRRLSIEVGRVVGVRRVGHLAERGLLGLGPGNRGVLDLLRRHGAVVDLPGGHGALLDLVGVDLRGGPGAAAREHREDGDRRHHVRIRQVWPDTAHSSSLGRATPHAEPRSGARLCLGATAAPARYRGRANSLRAGFGQCEVVEPAAAQVESNVQHGYGPPWWSEMTDVSLPPGGPPSLPFICLARFRWAATPNFSAARFAFTRSRSGGLGSAGYLRDPGLTGGRLVSFTRLTGSKSGPSAFIPKFEHAVSPLSIACP